MLLAIVGILSVLIGCDPSAEETDDAVDVVFRDTKLRVPQKYMLPVLPKSIVPQDHGLDDSRELSLRIPVADLEIATDVESGASKGVIVLLTYRSDEQMPRSAKDAWNAEGLYETRIVEFDYSVGLYRVYPKSGYPKIWHYFVSSPEDSKATSARWVASCNSPPTRSEKLDLSNVICKSVIKFKDFESHVTLTGEYVDQLEIILQRFECLLASWEAL